jgi:hypothetical protein
LDKYEDYGTNPGNESVERVLARINQETTGYYIVKMGNTSARAIRINRLENGLKRRIAPIFILPEYQNKGIVQKVFELKLQRLMARGVCRIGVIYEGSYYWWKRLHGVSLPSYLQEICVQGKNFYPTEEQP